MSNDGSYDVAIVGGGIVGAAIAFGLAGRGQRVAVFDEGDRALRAARANFGLVWVQSKGDRFPAYLRWTRHSADLWPEFSRAVEAESGVSLAYCKKGGLIYCVGETEFDAKRAALVRQEAHTQLYGVELLERGALERLHPGVRLGDEVTGATYGCYDGACNPLTLLRGLHVGMARRGASFFPGARVDSVVHRERRFIVAAGGRNVEAGKVVLAAGHGNSQLAPSLDLPAPIRAERGQILVTERVAPLLPLPASGLRQTVEGTVLIGASKEDAGLNDGTTVPVGAKLAARALRILPQLARARLVRTWGGVRVLTPDGAPVYAESPTCPGAYIAICHSGVTLAAAHADDLAQCIAAGRIDESLNVFHAERFHVPATTMH